MPWRFRGISARKSRWRGDNMEIWDRLEKVRFFTIISVAFLLLGLSPISRFFSVFIFFEPDFYFIPQYVPYAISILSAILSTHFLAGNRSKIYVAAMTALSRTCIIVSVFMIGFFLLNSAMVHLGRATIPEYCLFQGTMECQNFWLDGHTNKLSLSLLSGVSRPIVITHISCSQNTEQYEPCDHGRCLSNEERVAGVKLRPGEASGFIIHCNDFEGRPITFANGEMFTGKIILRYHYADEPRANLRKLVGSISVRED
jgi:hypothetical protein